ncbi:hypothetical protein ABBQ38_002550 [Trebouxia sp. C0009 RCD-2024]
MSTLPRCVQHEDELVPLSICTVGTTMPLASPPHLQLQGLAEYIYPDSSLQSLAVGDNLATSALEDILKDLRALNAGIRARRAASAGSVDFSAVSWTQATQLVGELQFTEVTGCEEAPLETPQGAADIPPFDFSKFNDEDAAAQEIMKYHDEQLRACGLPMGCRNGYKVHDLHKQKLYSVQIGQKRCTGGVDGGVLPYAVLPASAAKLLRIGFLHKQSTEDKAAYRLNNPDMKQGEVAEGRPYTFDEGRAQAICCLLAAHAMCQLPMDIDLTDGRQHHLLRLRDYMLLVYEGCTPTQAYHAMAGFLISQGGMSASKTMLRHPPPELEETLSRPIKKLREMAPAASLTEQVQSLISLCPSVEDQLSSYGILAVERQTRCGTAPTCRQSISHRDETAKSHLFGSTEVEHLRNLVAIHPAAIGVEWGNHIWDSFLPVLFVNRLVSLSVCQVSLLSACLTTKTVDLDRRSSMPHQHMMR